MLDLGFSIGGWNIVGREVEYLFFFWGEFLLEEFCFGSLICSDFWEWECD